MHAKYKTPEARRRSCESKRPYPSKRRALEIAGRMATQTGLPMRVYRCAWVAKHWHVTRDLRDAGPTFVAWPSSEEIS